MTEDRPSHENHGKTRMSPRMTWALVLVPLIVVLLVVASWQLFPGQEDVDKEQLEGREIPFRPNDLLVFEDGLYASFYKETKSTFDEDGVIEPGEYRLSDIFYKVFDGSSWGEEIALTPPDDDYSVSTYYSWTVFEGRIHAFMELKTMVDKGGYSNDTSNWRREPYMFAYDGAGWDMTLVNWTSSISHLFEYDGMLWVLGKMTEDQTYPYRTIHGGVWGDGGAIPLPDLGPGDYNFTHVTHNQFVPAGDSLWHIYQAHIANHIYLRSYDGSAWSEGTEIYVSEFYSTGVYPSLGYSFISGLRLFNGRLIIVWSEISMDWTASAAMIMDLPLGGQGKVMTVCQSPEENSRPFISELDGKLDIVWLSRNIGQYGAPLSSQVRTRTYDGATLGPISTLLGPAKGSPFDIDHLVTFKGKVWLFWGHEDEKSGLRTNLFHVIYN